MAILSLPMGNGIAYLEVDSENDSVGTRERERDRVSRRKRFNAIRFTHSFRNCI